MAVSGDGAGRRAAGPEPTWPEPTWPEPTWPGPARLLVAAAVLVVVLGVVAVVVTMSHPERLGFAFSGGGRPPAVTTGAQPGGVGGAEAAADQVLAAPLAGTDRRDGVAAGELLGSPNWDGSTGRLYLDLVAGANTVSVGGG